jgi:TonB family protein
MRINLRLHAIVLGLAMTVTACDSPPTADVDAAKAAVDKAATDRADQYAADSLKTARDAQAALDLELKAQEAKWVKSYGKTKELAVAAKAAGDKAAAEATAAKEKSDAAAAKVKADAAGGQIKPPTKVKDVTPVYPAIARSARVAGAVVIAATIDEEGKVIDAKVVRSVPMLDQAALDAVQQWEYMPTLLNGVPVPVLVTVTINFKP